MFGAAGVDPRLTSNWGGDTRASKTSTRMFIRLRYRERLAILVQQGRQSLAFRFTWQNECNTLSCFVRKCLPLENLTAAARCQSSNVVRSDLLLALEASNRRGSCKRIRDVLLAL